MNLHNLEILVAVATHGNLSRAARSANLSKSALSRSIQALESELGTALVDRSKRELELTTAGLVVFSHAQDILARANDLARQVGVLRGEKRLRLNLGAGPYAADLLVTDAVAEFSNVKPHVRVQYIVGNRNALRLSLLARELEIMVSGIGDFENPEGIELEPLAQHKAFFVVRPSHPLAGKRDVDLDQVFSFPLAVGINLGARLMGPVTKHMSGRSQKPIPAIECDDFLALRKILKQTDAISAFPLASIETEIRNGELTAIPFHLPWMSTDFGFVQLRDRPLSPAATELKRLIMEKNLQALARGEQMEKQLFGARSQQRPQEAGAKRRRPARLLKKK